MRPYHVVIVGSGPSGFFAAASLLKAADASEDIDVAVDMLEMLPTPWGLVRSGVAPDHPKIKSISKQFEKIAEDPRFRFFGNVVVGKHVSSRRTRRAVRRRDLCDRGAIGSFVEDSRRGSARQHGRSGIRGLVQRAPALPRGLAGPVGRPGRRRRQRQRRAGRRPHPGDRPRCAGTHRYRRPRLGVAAPVRCGGSGDHRAARAASDGVHHAGAARAGGPRRGRRDRRSSAAGRA